jgi:hypothetical protein
MPPGMSTSDLRKAAEAIARLASTAETSDKTFTMFVEWPKLAPHERVAIFRECLSSRICD